MLTFLIVFNLGLGAHLWMDLRNSGRSGTPGFFWKAAEIQIFLSESFMVVLYALSHIDKIGLDSTGAIPAEYTMPFLVIAASSPVLILFAILAMSINCEDLKPPPGDIRVLLHYLASVFFVYIMFMYAPGRTGNVIALALAMPLLIVLAKVFNPAWDMARSLQGLYTFSDEARRNIFWECDTRMLMYALYLAAAILLACYQVAAGGLGEMMEGTGGYGYVDYFITGMVVYLALKYAMVMLLMTPIRRSISTGYHQSAPEALEVYTARRQGMINFFHSRYDQDAAIPPYGAFLIIAADGIYFWAIGYFDIISPLAAVNLAILLPPVILSITGGSTRLADN